VAILEPQNKNAITGCGLNEMKKHMKYNNNCLFNKFGFRRFQREGLIPTQVGQYTKSLHWKKHTQK